MSKRLFLFDLDGVILNSRTNMEAAWAEVRQRTQVTVPFEKYFALIGRPFPEILRLLGIVDEIEEIEQVFRIASMNKIDLATFYPGIEEVLALLQKEDIALGIVTSKDRHRTGAILAKLPVRFEVIKTPNEQFRGKPAPDHLLAAMAEANVDPSETIYIGDMDADYEAAARAGIDYAHASWGYGQAPSGGTKILGTTQEIAMLREIDR